MDLFERPWETRLVWWLSDRLACSPTRLKTAVQRAEVGRRGSFRFRIFGKRSGRASTPGFAQAVGKLFQPGDSLVVEGRAPRDTHLRVRAYAGKALYEARFNDLGLHRGGRVRVVFKRRGKSLTIRLIGRDGSVVAADTLRARQLGHHRSRR